MSIKVNSQFYYLTCCLYCLQLKVEFESFTFDVASQQRQVSLTSESAVNLCSRPPGPTWNWWTSCWSVEKGSGRGSDAGCGDNASSTGARCAAASPTSALRASPMARSTPPRHSPPYPSPLGNTCSSQSVGGNRWTTPPHLVFLCLSDPTPPLHRQTGGSHRGAHRVYKGYALIVAGKILFVVFSVVLQVKSRQQNLLGNCLPFTFLNMLFCTWIKASHLPHCNLTVKHRGSVWTHTTQLHCSSSVAHVQLLDPKLFKSVFVFMRFVILSPPWRWNLQERVFNVFFNNHKTGHGEEIFVFFLCKWIFKTQLYGVLIGIKQQWH